MMQRLDQMIHACGHYMKFDLFHLVSFFFMVSFSFINNNYVHTFGFTVMLPTIDKSFAVDSHTK